MPTQIAVFELELEAVDHETDRRRWNGGPMPSRDADAALTAAVNAFRGVMRELGFDLVRTGYGVRAYEVAAPEEHQPCGWCQGEGALRVADGHYGRGPMKPNPVEVGDERG